MELRKQDFPAVEGTAPESHCCCFYATKQDLLDIVVPYFKDGLERNESCLWIISDPLSKDEAKNALRKLVPDLDRYETASSMEFVLYQEWYLKEGAFDSNRLIQGWRQKLDRALARGHAGLRVSGDAGWLPKQNWQDFLDYETKLNGSIPDRRMHALCTYPAATSAACDLLDVARAHQAVAARRNGAWELLKAPQLRQSLQQVQSLAASQASLNDELAEREGALQDLRQQKEILQTIFDHIPVMISFVGDDDRIRLVNREWERTLGWTLEEIQQRDLDIFAECYPDPEYRRHVLDFVANSNGNWATFKMRLRDGRVIDTNWTVVRRPDGTCIGMGRDVTDRSRAEEALREAQESFRQLTENIEELFWIKTLDFKRVLYLSPNYDRVTGRSSERHLESDGVQFVLDMIHPDDRASMAEIMRRADGKEFEIEFRVVTLDGSVRWIRERGFPIHDQSGKADRMAGIVENITDRKLAEQALRESEERFRQLAENIRELFWMKTPDFKRVLYLSPSYESLTGRDREARYRDQGRDEGLDPFLEMIHPEDRAAMAEVIRRADGQEFEIEFRISMPDGSLRWIRDRGFPIRDRSGQVYRIAGIAQNITARKLAEERLKATSEQLRALSASLQSAREEERTRIAREIHDELGSSLTILKWDLEGLEKTVSALVDPSRVAPLQEKAASMLKLADTIIHTVKRIASDLRPSILDDIGLVEAIEWQAQQFQARTGIACHFSRALEEAHLNEERSTAVFRIFQEALTNVLRHAQATAVDIAMHEHEGAFVLAVADNGRGITDGEKSDPSSLGLLGMQERAHLVGGTIEIAGMKPNGTAVTVQVPTSMRRDDSTSGESMLKRILIVDDHAVVRDGVKRIFDDLGDGAAFGEASTGTEALQLARQQLWDVAVLDLSLGEAFGLDVLKELKQVRPKLPVLILSMHSEEQYARRAFRAGAAGYITKDSPRAELVEAINRVIEGRRYVSSALAEKLVTDLEQGAGHPRHETLSDREFEVMCLIASGKTLGQIAELLSLSDKTISTYRARILEKMGMQSSAEITHYAIRNKLVG